MAEKEQSPYPLVPTNGHARSDEESDNGSAELRKKKRMKCVAYIVAFAVFQTIIIVVFALFVMRFKSPKFRVRDASFVSTFNFTNASFDLVMDTQFTIKNTNFGHFKYEHGSVTFSYDGMIVGEAQLGEARARARSTKKVDRLVTLSSSDLPTNSKLTSDLGGGILPLTSNSKLDGKIHLMKVIKKKKSALMDCTLEVNLGMKKIQNVQCK
ncbi:late embryogenesis abundant protein At1g64065-like [Quercus lobata]|uniref:Late embryogenesis abundant protein LEA-2 subgroup domain-containing protein n=1 Tax=Quercus lobata TaxID=97700 RepID=A0A7N2MHS5_QUELO|nr:late embryogenesis abundant protein At1g64065-like [Quercus lobata]